MTPTIRPRGEDASLKRLLLIPEVMRVVAIRHKLTVSKKHFNDVTSCMRASVCAGLWCACSCGISIYLVVIVRERRGSCIDEKLVGAVMWLYEGAKQRLKLVIGCQMDSNLGCING